MALREKERMVLRLMAGDVKRYHTHPIIGEQNVGHHTYRAAQILRYLHPMPSTQLLGHVLDHDVAEAITGDMPFGAKTPDQEDQEEAVLKHYNIDPLLTPEEKQFAKAADLLEMGMFGITQMELGNSHGQEIVEAIVKALEPLTGINARVEELWNALKSELAAQLS